MEFAQFLLSGPSLLDGRYDFQTYLLPVDTVLPDNLQAAQIRRIWRLFQIGAIVTSFVVAFPGALFAAQLLTTDHILYAVAVGIGTLASMVFFAYRAAQANGQIQVWPFAERYQALRPGLLAREPTAVEALRILMVEMDFFLRQAQG